MSKASLNGGFQGADKRTSSEGVFGWERAFFRKNYTLDAISTTGLVRAYALRRLSSTYNGDLIRVRNGSTGIVSPIGFDGEGINTSALAAAMGSASGFVPEVFDQSLSATSMTQPILLSQPRIYNSGVLESLGGKPCLTFDGTDDSLISDIISGIANNSNLSLFAVFVKTNNNSGTIINQGRTASYFNFGLVSGASTNPTLWRNTNNDYAFSGNNTISVNQVVAMSAVSTAGSTSLFINNVLIGTTANGVVSGSVVSGNELAVGKRAGASNDYAPMKLVEWMIFTRDISANERTVLTNNALTYYSS
jgi:hypothetical protein